MKGRISDIIKRARKHDANIRGAQTRKLRKEYGAWDIYLVLTGIAIGILITLFACAYAGVL